MGLYIGESFCDSFQVCGMSQCGLIPKVFSRRSYKFDTPHVALFGTLFMVLILITFDFEVLMNMVNAFAAAVEILIILSSSFFPS
jgi:amino acid transporter